MAGKRSLLELGESIEMTNVFLIEANTPPLIEAKMLANKWG